MPIRGSLSPSDLHMYSLHAIDVTARIGATIGRPIVIGVCNARLSFTHAAHPAQCHRAEIHHHAAPRRKSLSHHSLSTHYVLSEIKSAAPKVLACFEPNRHPEPTCRTAARRSAVLLPNTAPHRGQPQPRYRGARPSKPPSAPRAPTAIAQNFSAQVPQTKRCATSAARRRCRHSQGSCRLAAPSPNGRLHTVRP